MDGILRTIALNVKERGRMLESSSVQFSNAREKGKERFTKVESRQGKKNESVDSKHMRNAAM